MPLTPDEIAFLGPALAEHSDLRYGPASQTLRGRGIRHDDLLRLVAAYKFIDPPGIETVVDPNGVTSAVLRLGRHQQALPPSPRPDAEVARHRNREPEVEGLTQREGETP